MAQPDAESLFQTSVILTELLLFLASQGFCLL